MPYRSLAKTVLEQWRAVERTLLSCDPASDEAEELRTMAHLLRDEYRHLTQAAIEHHRAVPPPFPSQLVVAEPSELDGTHG